MPKCESTVWHVLLVHTPSGDVWEPACQFIRSPELAQKTARHLAAFLAGVPAAQVDAPRWARSIRKRIAADGTDIATCRVEIAIRSAVENVAG